MKKSIAIIIILLAIVHITSAQDTLSANYRHNLSIAKDDTSRVWAMVDFGHYYKGTRPDSALIYGYRALKLAREMKFRDGEFVALELLIIVQGYLGNTTKQLQLIYQADRIVTKNMLKEKATLVLNRGGFYEYTKNYTQALSMYKEAKKIFDSLGDSVFSPFAQVSMGKMYMYLHRRDSALYHCETAYKNAIQWVPQYILPLLGRVHVELGNTDSALSYFRQTLINATDTAQFCDCYLFIAQLYRGIGKQDSAIVYGGKSLALARRMGLYNGIIDANLFLSQIYENRDFKQALLYSKDAISYKDSLRNMAESATQETFANLDEQERQREIDDAKAQLKNRLQIYVFIGVTVTFLIIASLLYRNSRLKQKAKQNIEKAYAELKSTQAQLVQSEKMASLGELTAGIAHEIQNPLNFVNNFSEVNNELIEELKIKNEKLKIEDDEVKELIDDIKQNLEKINHHGKRADAIVKGMLQHSRKSEGVKESTDINALCDEYLRLSYHGLRAKDKDFNAKIKTDFDPRVGRIDIVSQDIGRMILNLVNNAFYAVNENAKQNIEGYEPTVTITTRSIQPPSGGRSVEIKVTDNGGGIPDNIVDKIFQPFFTTKPTGQGTGLGLSLAYDIIKAHGGEIKVKTTEGAGSSFIIELPERTNIP